MPMFSYDIFQRCSVDAAAGECEANVSGIITATHRALLSIHHGPNRGFPAYNTSSLPSGNGSGCISAESLQFSATRTLADPASSQEKLHVVTECDHRVGMSPRP
jgi:hypothetical protein